jgi:hypothetical protein
VQANAFREAGRVTAGALYRDQFARCIGLSAFVVKTSFAVRGIGIRGSMSSSISTGGYSSICRASAAAVALGSSTVPAEVFRQRAVDSPGVRRLPTGQAGAETALVVSEAGHES